MRHPLFDIRKYLGTFVWWEEGGEGFGWLIQGKVYLRE